MLAFTRTPANSRTKKCTPNVLPCRIHHSGPIKVHKRHWQPTTSESDGTCTSHFRGRRLRGRSIDVPVGYKGELRGPLRAAPLFMPSREGRALTDAWVQVSW